MPEEQHRQDHLTLQDLALQKTAVAEARPGAATREDEAGKSTTSSKRKPSTSATRNESEARLRRQLQHNTEKLERSERARTETGKQTKSLSGCSCTP